VKRAERRPTEGPPWAWRLVVGVVLWLLRRRLGWRVRAQKPEVVPPPGAPLVVVYNHTSSIDPFLVADTVWHGLQHWGQPLAKAELFDIPVFGILVRAGGTIPVARDDDSGREAAYDEAVAKLRAGRTIMLAPEGTTTHDGSLLPLRHGAARLALEAGADVLVVTHFGAQRGFSPVVRFPDRGVLVTLAMDLVTPWPDENASSLTGRIAATMLDRSAQLQASYPQADPDARWWPPYSAPASPTATARESLKRYQDSMAETVAHARERMARMAEEHEVEQRVAQARARAIAGAEDLTARSRARVEEFTEQTRERMEELSEHTRERMEELSEHTRDRAEELGEQTRERMEELMEQARARMDELVEQTLERVEELTAQARERAGTHRPEPHGVAPHDAAPDVPDGTEREPARASDQRSATGSDPR
jgi:1-acyl-sn-glycerol-3-phosphate acyltransferase